MEIDAFITPYFQETESQFDGSIVIMIDVLRASATICAALCNGAKEVIASDTHEKAVKIYSSLSKESRFLGGERNGMKPSGFDAGNSPKEYTRQAVEGKTVILATTNGTKIFQKAKQAKLRIIGSFVNINAVMDFIAKNYLAEENAVQQAKITILCAGTNSRLSYEDTLCAGAFINRFKKNFQPITLTDSADAAKNLYNLHYIGMNEFLKTREHARFLEEIGFGDDIETALTYDLYPVVPIISGASIKIYEESSAL